MVFMHERFSSVCLTCTDTDSDCPIIKVHNFMLIMIEINNFSFVKL